MKQLIKKSCVILATATAMTSCKKFTDLNRDPLKADEDQVQVEYFIDNSIVGAQQEPGLAERMFILYWVPGGRAMEDEDGTTFSQGGYDDGWSTEYFNQASGWQNTINSAISIGTNQIAKGISKPYTPNLIQVARIWRAYLMTEMADVFGPIPIKASQGVNPSYSDVKAVYYYALDELKDAGSKLDFSAGASASAISKQDPAFGYDFAKWRKYANSMRMRLAMRLSEVDAAKAKTEFEAAAAANDYITDADQTFQVQETTTYDALSSVFRIDFTWMSLPISATLNNLSVGLGGIKTADQKPEFASSVKPADWMGQKFTDYFSTQTNDPMAGYWFNGLPYTIDPRIFQIFTIPGNTTDPLYPNKAGLSGQFKQDSGYLNDANGNHLQQIDAQYTWNAKTDGNWGAKGDMNALINTPGCKPILNMKFRGGTNKRVFFGPWESYFLLAEAAERGWATPIDAQTAYETGISKSFEYMGVSVGSYLTSTDYNRVGTSVSWTHTIDPPASRTMNYEDGVTGTPGTVQVPYPVNNLYKAGAVKNDHLTKIITQKFIAQMPWLPLETWSDHRRLGLPFFENPVVEKSMPSLPALNGSSYTNASIQFLPQRVPYSTALSNNNKTGYQQAVTELGGPDVVLTPLWWAQQH